MTTLEELNFYSLMSGQNLDILKLKQVRREIRLFMSIVGGDMDVERMTLMKQVYKQLRHFCRCKYGIECYVFDPDWGLSFFPNLKSFQGQIKKMVYNESKLSSLGPYFLGLVGQRYGSSEPPYLIDRYEFECIYSSLELDRSRSSRDHDVLKDCYHQDKNSFRREYLMTSQALQVVRGRLEKNFRTYTVGGSFKFMEGNNDGTLEKEMEKITDDEVLMMIAGLLRYGAKMATCQTKFKSMECFDCFKSDFHKELEKFLADNQTTCDRCLIVSRRICDLANFFCCEQSSKFAEFTPDGRLDPRHSGRLERLLEEFRWKNEDVEGFDVLWRFPGGIDANFHDEYPKKMADSVLTKVKDKVNKLLPHPLRQLTLLQSEVFHHLQMVANHVERFVGREEELGESRSYICSGCHHVTSLIIHGEHATGKAALGSKIFQESCNWLADVAEVIRVVRFVGSTQESSKLLSLLDSIVAQINVALHFQGESEVPDTSTDITDAIESLHQTLKRVPCDKKLIIVLISMDSIDPEHGAWTMHWLPVDLSVNVRVVMTVHGCSEVMTSLRSLEDYEFSFLELSGITESEATAILLLNMAPYGRTLTGEQTAVVSQNCFNASSISPLLPLVIVSHVLVHESWQTLDAESMSHFNSVETCFNSLLEKIEDLIGSDITARMIGILTSAAGLSDCEMEDVMTRDPAVRGHLTGSEETCLKFPAFVWMFVRYVLKPLLREQYTHGVVVRRWRHELLATMAANRYLLRVEDARSVNCSLVEHWLSEKGPDNCKLVLLEQPLRFDTKDVFEFCSKNPPLYNKRLLIQLPIHLKRAERDEEFLERVVFNFEWIFSKTVALSLRRVIYDLRLALTPEVRILEEAMIDAESFINDDVTNMAYELTRRLLMFRRTHSKIRSLIDSMDMSTGAFIVGFPLWKIPVCALEAEVECNNPVISVSSAYSRERRVLLCKNPSKEEVEMVGVRERRHLASLTTSLGLLYASPNGRWLAVVECPVGSSASINVHDLNNGNYVGHVIVTASVGSTAEDNRLSHVMVTDSAICYVVSGERSWLSVKALDGTGSDLDKDLAHVDLKCRPSLCRLTPDQSLVFTNSGRSLIGCPTTKLANGALLTLNLNLLPVCLCFNDTSDLAFVAFQGNYLSVVDFSRGELKLHKTFDMFSYFNGDVIRDLAYHKRGQILVRSDSYLALFEVCCFCVKFRLKKPEDLLFEFRFPKSPLFTKIKFEDAIFVGDHVAAAVLRDVRIYSQDGCLVAIFKTPIARLVRIFASEPEEKSEVEEECPPPPSLIATVSENYKKIQIWRTDRAADHVNAPDRIPTDVIRQIEVGSDGGVVAARGECGYEVGVFDPATGHIADLLTHEEPVKDFCLSGDGHFMLVSMVRGKKGRVNKIWDVQSRRMMAEFEDTASVAIAAQTQQRFFCFVEYAAGKKFKIYKVTFKPAKKVIDQGPEVQVVEKTSCVTESYGDGNESCKVEKSESCASSKTAEHGKSPSCACASKSCCCCVIEDDVTDAPVLPSGQQWRASIRDTGVQVTKFKQRPFVTCQDGWLVLLSDDYLDDEDGTFISQRIFAVKVKKRPPCYNAASHISNTGRLESDSEEEDDDDTFGDRGAQGDRSDSDRKSIDPDDIIQIYPSDLRKWAPGLQRILKLRKHPTAEDLIIVFFTNKCDPCCCEADFTCFGFLVLNVPMVEVVCHMEELLPPKSKLDRVIFSRDMQRVYDTKSDVYSLCDASWLGQIRPEFKSCPGRKQVEIEGHDTESKFGLPMGIIIDNSAILYLKDEFLTAVRLRDCMILGRISVHTKVCSLAIGADQRTVYVGGLDGSVASYVVVDREEEGDKMAEIIASIPSRKMTSFCVRVWDNRNPFPDYSRPPSMPPPSWKATEDLNKLNESETAPHQDRGGPPRKSIQVSKTCSMM